MKTLCKHNFFCCLFSLVVLHQNAYAQTCVNGIRPSNPTGAYGIGLGVIIDSRSGLMWDLCSWGQSGPNCATNTASEITWQQALMVPAAANTSLYRGYADWRLPNIKELRSLIESCSRNPATNDTVFPATPAWYFWSNSASTLNADYAWGVHFGGGQATLLVRSDVYHVRLVRAGR